MKLKWRTITYRGYSHYQVSNYGDLLNTRTGYITIGYLVYNKFRVFEFYNKTAKRRRMSHLVVLDHFHIKELGKECGEHINQILEDNRSNNLQWISRSELQSKRMREAWKRKRLNRRYGVHKYQHSTYNYYRTIVCDKNKVITLGYFKTKQEAELLLNWWNSETGW